MCPQMCPVPPIDPIGSVQNTVLSALHRSSQFIFKVTPLSGTFYPHFNKDVGTADRH